MDFVEKEKTQGSNWDQGVLSCCQTDGENRWEILKGVVIMATKITNKELYQMVMEDRARLDEIDNGIKSILAILNSNPTEGKSSSEKTEKKTTKKTTKESPKATKCTVTVEDGQGRGQGKKFIKVIFDGKPTDKTLKSLKEKGFTYFAPTKAWSSLLTDAKLEFAKSLTK